MRLDDLFCKEYHVVMKTKNTLNHLANLLAEYQLLAHDKVQDVVDVVFAEGLSLIRYVVKEGLVDSIALAKVFSQLFQLPLWDLDTIDWQAAPLSRLNEVLIKTYHVLPLMEKDERLILGISDPFGITNYDALTFYTHFPLDYVLVEEHKLTYYINHLLSRTQAKIAQRNAVTLEELPTETQPLDYDYAADNPEDDAPIVRYIQHLLLDAIDQNASDIHFEPYENAYRIRWRQDGLLKEIATPPAHLGIRLAARLKILSQLDIAERRLPQDGRFKLKAVKNEGVDFRVSTCPTLFGEKVVLRILNSTTDLLRIDDLGMTQEQQQQLIHAIHQPQGLILVTGPTGSGKTRTLYTALNIINTTDRNISTVEDPVEINLPGINQVNINPKAGLYFDSVLRAFLRQDPDIIMVGEIRDKETADIAIQAAHTGHLVLSTLHTNSAVETLTRLINMGVAPFNIATSLSLIIAQRLVRKLCEYCKTWETIPFLEQEVTVGKANASGCDRCEQGYKGRMGLYEILPISHNMSPLIMQQAHPSALLALAQQEGMLSLREDGLKKVMAGLTSLQELNRVVNE